MQIVIDIPEEDYEYLKAHNKHGLYSSILNGTVLPKGHGRLIDVDAIKKKYPLMYNEIGMEFNVGINRVLDEAPTILEADKEGEISNGSYK